MKRKVSAVTSSDADSISQHLEDAAEGQPSNKRQHTRRSLFVRSLPSDCGTETLINHFSEEFPIKHATAIRDPKTNTCRGYGFITFADSDDAQRALEKFQGTKIGTNAIKLSIAEPRQRTTDGARDDGQDSQPKTDLSRLPPKLIVRNLPWTIKGPEQLSKLFRSYGKIKFATVPTKKAGTQYGFGIVLLRGRKNAEKALQALNGKVVDGRTLAVDWAVDRDTWEQQKDSEPVEEVEELDQLTASTSALVKNDSNHDVDDDASSVVSEGRSSESSTDQEDVDTEDSNFEIKDQDTKTDENSSSINRKPEDYSVLLFIRNVPFDSTDETLYEHFLQFGRLRYARVVYDQNTERPKGTAFVCFKDAQDAAKCLRNAPKETHDPGSKTNGSSTTGIGKSILQNEDFDPTGTYTMGGRVLQVSRAVDRQQAEKLSEASAERRADDEKDKRRMFLLAEGVIPRSSSMYQLLNPGEVAMRDASMKQRKSLLQSNPSLHLSLTRLSVRNLPRSVTSKDLKQLARQAVVGFAQDVRDGKRERLSKEETERGGEDMMDAERVRKQRGVGVVKQAKIVFESREGSKVTEKSGGGRSRGYGFIEYYTHRSALMGLRYLNGHAVEFKPQELRKGHDASVEVGKKKRLIVEFAIENAQVVNRRKDKESRARDPEHMSEERLKSKKGKKEEEVPSSQQSEEQQKQAKRQRIINKKRALRRQKRKVTGKA